MRFRLIPREERFFEMFVEDAANVLSAARHLEEMLKTYDDIEQRAKELFAMEHHGDELSHAIGKKLNTTFVTPFDREDIHALISGLDDVLDLIEEIGDTFLLYQVEAPTPASVHQATSSLVLPAMAETTTATFLPVATSAATSRATRRIRSRSATEVPPNFITRRDTWSFRSERLLPG